MVTSRLSILPALILTLFLVACASRPDPGAIEAVPARVLSDAEPNVRVLVMDGVELLRVDLLADGTLTGSETEQAVPLASDSAIVIEAIGPIVTARDATTDVELLTAPVLYVETDAAAGRVMLRDDVTGATPRGNPEYEGLLEVRSDSSSTVAAIFELPVEEYLRGVVPFEIGVTAPFEAMKAQAVAARSETITALVERTYSGTHYDICSDVQCQVFRGAGRQSERTDASIAETRGVILTYDGAPIPAYYSSNSGGHTEDIRNVWPDRDRGIPVWDGVFDGDPADAPADLRVEENAREWLLSPPAVYTNPELHPDIPSFTHPNFRWEVTHTAEDLSAAVARTSDIGRILAIETGHRGPSARLVSVRFVGEDGSLEVGPELTIRRTFDPALRSSAFIVEPVGDSERPEAFRIIGAGFGHGVGLCQTGAMGRALAGQSYDEILLHYYEGAELERLYE